MDNSTSFCAYLLPGTLFPNINIIENKRINYENNAIRGGCRSRPVHSCLQYLMR